MSSAARRRSAPRRRAARLLEVITTVGTQREARAMASALVERELAACVHVWPIESHYRWQGRRQRAREYRLVCKTTTRRYRALAGAIKALHSYELPCLYALAPREIDAPYAHWVQDSCRPDVTSVARARGGGRPKR